MRSQKLFKSRDQKKESKSKRKVSESDDDQQPDYDEFAGENEHTLDNDDKNAQIASENIKRKAESKWFDPDDKEIEMDISQVARLRKLRKNDQETMITGEELQARLEDYYQTNKASSSFYEWANKLENNEQELSSLDSILKTKTSIIEGSKRDSLPQEIIKMAKISSLPLENRHQAVIQSIDFHPNGSTMFTASLDKTVKIFNLGRTFEKNKYELKPLKTVHFKNLPIMTAQVNSSRNEILVSGMKKYIVAFDLVKESFEKSSPSFITDRLEGKVKSFLISPDESLIALYGYNEYVMMLSAKTKTLLYEFRMNSEVSSLAFSPDSSQLFTSTDDATIYQWDLGSRKIMDMFPDVGVTKTNCVDFSADGNFLVSGNSLGTANIYQFNKLSKTLTRQPIKEITNLTTSIDNAKINPESEMIAISSKWKRNGIRLVHMASRTVFSNWPNMRTKLSYINKVQFSRDSKYMGIGNDLGNVIVYNFAHYNQTNMQNYIM